MAKGFFMQTVVVLLREKISQDAIRQCLDNYEVAKEVPPAEDWQFGGPSLTVAYRPEVNGYVSVDIVDRPWPDHMGDPREEAMLFAAWSMGHFGPYAFPGGLERAIQHSWTWDAAKQEVPQHKAFLRLRLSYIFGCHPGAPCAPADAGPFDELRFLTGMTLKLLEHPASICYFNPNGEVLLPGPSMTESLSYHSQHDIPPLDLWSNVRFFNISDDWSFMDCVGNWQFDLPDHEVGFPVAVFSPQEVDRFIRNASLYVIQNGEVIRAGDTMDGPGEIHWQARILEDSLVSPPRRVYRWLPTGYREVPDMLLAVSEDADNDVE